MKKITYFLTIIRSPKKLIQSMSYLINDEHYWDAYVKSWKSAHPGLHIVGQEWGGHEVFVSLLEHYANPAHRALEIGCGGGKITSRAVDFFGTVYAADVSQYMLAKCRETVGDRVQYIKLDGFTLKECADSSMDMVYSHDVFVHFAAMQVYSYLNEIKRVLKNGGIGMISFYDTIRHFNLFREMSIRFNTERRFPPHMRVHFLTEEILIKMVEDLNMEVVNIDRTNFLILTFRKPQV